MLMSQHRDIQCHIDEWDDLKEKTTKNTEHFHFYTYGEWFYMSVSECVFREIAK